MLLQHYYTSCVALSGAAGFQVKAMSQGIPLHLSANLLRHVSYRIPLSLDCSDTSAHPVALRYERVGGQESFLLCVQSSGGDENGRPGNFFAHSLVLLRQQELLQALAPIMYWKSPFWRLRDEDHLASLPSLPGIESVPIGPTLEERMWALVASHRPQFYKLMCAVVHSRRTGRRIIIVGEDEEVALWIAAVTWMVPPACRPFVTFSTYSHDPYQSPSLIIGTSHDSLFQCNQSEYHTFFILNTHRKEISAVDDSDYAAFVTRFARPAEYERELLSFFVWCNDDCHIAMCLDESLDQLARGWRHL